MRVMILILVLALAIIAVPVLAQGYGSTSPPASSTPSSEAAPAPPDTSEPSMEASPTPSMESTPPATSPPTAETPAIQPTPAPATSTMSTTTTMSSTTESQPLVMSTVIRYYNIDPVIAAQLQAKGYTANDFAMLGNLSARSGKPISEFVGLRDKNVSWSDIADRYHVSAVDMGVPTAMMMSPDVDAYNRQFANQYFGLSDAEVTTLRAQGMSWGEVYMTANLARRSSQPVSQIASLRSQGVSWVDIGSRYDVASSDISSPFAISGRVAGVATEVTPMAYPIPIYDKAGNIVLTQRDAWIYQNMGYTWRDLAFASNVSRSSGVPIDAVLRSMDTGKPWPWIARDYRVHSERAMDLSDYPFTHEPLSKMDRQRMKQMP
jgi:hypothetical protein